ncbi:outer membrane beta-barrel protein [candidate division KSB1 bacterium]
MKGKGLIILLVFLFCTDVFSQENKISYSMGGGMNIPSPPGDFRKIWNKGINLTADGYYRLNDNIGAGLQLGMYYFGFNDNYFLRERYWNQNTIGGEIIIVTLMPYNRHSLNRERFSPYIELGMGLFNIYRREIEITGCYDHVQGYYNYTYKSHNETRLGLRFGGGVEIIRHSKCNVLLDFIYIAGFTNKTKFLYLSPFEIEGAFSFFTSGIKLKFN